jgi:fatty-acyl-CoA synthase
LPWAVDAAARNAATAIGQLLSNIEQKIHFVAQLSRMAVLDTAQAPPRGRNQSALRDWVRALEATAPIAAKPRRILPAVIEELAQQRGDGAALISASESLSYRSLTQRVNRYARWALDQKLAKGETVCLVMPNRPEYVAVWLGISAVGGVVALINTHLRGPSLAHCIDLAAPKHVIVAAELVEAFRSASAHLSTRPKIWSHGDGGGGFSRIDRALEQFSAAALTMAERRAVTIADPALLIYTSGTTGLPKAAKVSHHRLMQWSFWFAGLMDTGPGDRMYDCLPMYHSIGGAVATGALLVRGGSVFIREKFSSREFWSEIRAWDCTLFQYIGELCRYLVNAPEHPDARAHRLRLCCGNGLRADIWEKFQNKFAISRILEFYAATEGNVSLYNVEGKVGAIGRAPSFLAHRFPLTLVKFDPARDQPARQENGFCIGCAAGEPGEAIGRIHDGSAGNGVEFEGYTGVRETEQKIIRDVFEHGDAWYRTGDLMRRDANGFYYFIDRIGDTFRWKGENVAASEVVDAITVFPGIVDASVYGVAVPGTEGAAGMAALVVDGGLDLVEFRAHLGRRLPSYARPLFLRIKDRIEMTATFKHRKVDLVSAGFDPTATGDAIYFDDPAQRAYVRLDRTLYRRIEASELRL